ncbi:penicillin-binding transpeptidase domain-containing protein [Nonomuraea sp. LPB2021202275-12-8]|uniref:penicillin-binding transpeptidase domain-containing protein n=1 Tax=Nonomuraea sp. LPB2021202275-12-8 TaxID=3120159 RepID=UPI00300CB8FD
MLVSAVLAVFGAVTFAVAASSGVKGSAAATSADYFEAWSIGDVEGMARLVYQPPGDFRARHLAMSGELAVESIELRPGAVKSTGAETAEVPFSGSRTLETFGAWPFDGTLRLAVRDRQWKVLWAPETLHPLLKDGGTVEVVDFDGPSIELVTREGDKIPHNSYADSTLARLRPEFEDSNVGWALVARAPGRPEQRIMTVEPKADVERTTLSSSVQAAAARALDGVANSAIIVLKPGTGEVLAVADRLEGGYSAFHDFFPPGSTFKIITAAALMKAGLEPDAQVACPGSYSFPQRRAFTNDGGVDRGLISFTDAFAHSCNTTFVEQSLTRLGQQDLRETAHEWGFGRPMPTGAQGACGSIEDPADPDFAASNAIGQGTAIATPLCMATIAAAVQDGTWRTPRLLTKKQVTRIDGEPPAPVELDSRIVANLRDMMRAAVDHGTASGAGLPDDVSGKTGTAEVDGQRSHGWFVGFREDLAFCVFVRHGGSGSAAAVPVATRFLNGL